MFHQFLWQHLATRHKDHGCLNHMAAMAVTDRKGRRFHHTWIGSEHCLNLVQLHPMAARLDLTVSAAEEEMVFILYSSY